MKPDSDHPRITLVTPSFNQGHFLRETIESVLSQGYPNLEYIVLDGGSTDDSVDIIREYADHLAWWVSEPDRGQSHAINKGFARATGHVLNWLNSDDVLCPGALDQVASFFRHNPGFGVMIGDQPVIDEVGREVDYKRAVPITYTLALYSMCAVPQPASFFTRKAWELAGGSVDESLTYQMDTMLYLRMLRADVSFGTVPVPITRFRVHADSKTVSEYTVKVQTANRRIQEELTGRSQERWVARTWWKVGRWVARTVLFLERMFLRGLVIPFRGTRARNRAARVQER